MIIMNTRQKMNFITRLRQNKVPQNKIDELFNLPEKELDKLYNISNNELFISEVAKILNNNGEKYSFYLDSLKQYKNKFSKEDYEEAKKIIRNCNQQFNARCAYMILKNEELQQHSLNISGARIVSRAKREINAQYALKILNIPKLIELRLAIPMASLIVGTENKEQCLNIIRTVLNNKEIYNEVKDIINKVTIYLRRTLITVPGHEEEATDLLNVFSEILNKPFIIAPVNVEKKRVRTIFSKKNN